MGGINKKAQQQKNTGKMATQGVLRPIPSGGVKVTLEEPAVLPVQLQWAQTLDYDLDAQNSFEQQLVGIALPAVGGPVAGGTPTAPLRIDPVGTTPQPVTDNNTTLSIDDGNGSITVDAPSSNPLYVRSSLLIPVYVAGVEGSLSYPLAKASQLPNSLNSFGHLKVGIQGCSRSDTYTAVGVGTLVDATTQPVQHFAIQVLFTGGDPPISWTVVLEGSLEGTVFTTILTHATADLAGTVKWSGTSFYPCRYFRSRCTNLNLGLATGLVVWILGTP